MIVQGNLTDQDYVDQLLHHLLRVLVDTSSTRTSTNAHIEPDYLRQYGVRTLTWPATPRYVIK